MHLWHCPCLRVAELPFRSAPPPVAHSIPKHIPIGAARAAQAPTQSCLWKIAIARSVFAFKKGWAECEMCQERSGRHRFIFTKKPLLITRELSFYKQTCFHLKLTVTGVTECVCVCVCVRGGCFVAEPVHLVPMLMELLFIFLIFGGRLMTAEEDCICRRAAWR